MDILNIEILNPKAEKLLWDMADMDLISIKNNPKISIAEITAEVKLVRENRNQKSQAMKEAAADPLFLADIDEITDDFRAVDHEGL